ncbi:MAG TPA: GMC family oxidoreductase [Candidatus Acidoferrum sp.]|nr:GMC family oxidoreductase [Candidatus Acidoferrum sp.]
MPQRQHHRYDVIVVGSGASGGWASKRLAEAGLKVALLEAGKPQSDQNFTEHKSPFELKYRNMAPEILRKTRPIQSKFACDEYNADWFVNDHEEPYTTPADMPFDWMGRMRVTGGRTNVWGRLCLRFSDWDFKAASRDGYGEDWPLSYKDLQSYYDLVERYVGISGSEETLEHLPDSFFQPPIPLTCQETLFRERVREKLGRVVMPARSANLTRSLNGRGPCHYCGPCERGCVTHSYFNSAFTTVADALASGNCTLISNAMVYKVLVDAAHNRANGVLYIDRVTREPQELLSRVVILCAQAQESVRILLNSATREYANGLANSSGVLGHYLTAHVRSAGGSAEFPALGTKPSVYGGGPHKPTGMYIARFRNIPNAPPYRKFLRGYGYESESSTDFNWYAPGFGIAYKKAVRVPRTTISITGFGEVLPRWDNFVKLDPSVKDIYGIPVLKIHMSDGENERAMIQDMGDSAGEMLEAAGAKNIRTYADPSAPRWALHEGGIARMGSDPKESMLNQFQQTHDIKNLFVMDASSFASNPCQNPTLTIMALCVRSCDYLMSEMKRNVL